MSNKRIFLSPPDIGNSEKELLNQALDSNWIAPLGPNVDSFEEEIAAYLGVQNACALSSGTAGLHLALRILGITKGDIVLCPSLTFAASANVLLYENAIPVFVDVDLINWTIDLSCLESAMKKYNPKAFIAVDLYGQSCDYDAITDLCEKYNVLLIEDAAEALGSEYRDEKCGFFGRIGILSFNGNKIITTSGGGMLVSLKNNTHVSLHEGGCHSADFVYVDDIINATLKSIDTLSTGIFNIGSGTRITLLEIADMVVDILKANKDLINVEPLSSCNVIQRYPLLDCTKAHRQWGYSPMSLKHGLQKMV